jgi:hypothetical protein
LAADDPALRSLRRLGDRQIFARRRHEHGSKDVVVPAYRHDRAMHEPNLAAINSRRFDNSRGTSVWAEKIAVEKRLLPERVAKLG